MGERLGKYELLHRIGVGGMAEVFVAETRGAEGFVKRVVIKRILPAFSQDPRFVRMFIDEAKLAARLRHANIVQIFDFDHVGDTYYLAMEWIDGSDLRRIQTVARRRQMPVPQTMAIHVGVEALKGLHHAHAQIERGLPLGIVHRDISPHNLLVSFSGEVKIVDFGIAKAASVVSATRTGAIKGKLSYMAPEQLAGEQVDGRADIFALGVVLWELVAGRRLYGAAASEEELLEKVRRCEIPSIRQVNREASPRLEMAVGRMLSVAVEARYQTAAEALADLSQLGGGGDALAVADYLCRLLPAESARDMRGQTVIGSAECQESPPAAETRTRLSSPRASPVDPPASGSAPRHRPVPVEGSVVRFSSWRHRAGAAAVAVACAVAGWLLSMPAAPPSPMTTEVTVHTDPTSARLWVDGVRTEGTTPVVLRGIAGSTVHARAERGAQVGSARIRFGTTSRALLVRLREPPPAKPSTGGQQRAQPDRLRSRGSSAAVQEALESPRQLARRGVPEPRRYRLVAKGWATLNVIVEPWAHVKVDDRVVGTTPLRGHRIVAGRHEIELSNPQLGRNERLHISAAAGETATVRRKWIP